MNTFTELLAIRDEKIAKAFVSRIVKSWKVYNDAICWISLKTLRELLPDGATPEDPVATPFLAACERIVFATYKARARRRAVTEAMNKAIDSISKDTGRSKSESRMLLHFELSHRFYEFED